MISIQKKFLFIHVPKTGGNSIQNILRDYSEDEIVTLAKHQDGVERFEVRNSKYAITKHSTLAHYKFVLDASTYHSLYKFATIRNPWDLLISYYFSPHRGITGIERNSSHWSIMCQLYGILFAKSHSLKEYLPDLG